MKYLKLFKENEEINEDLETVEDCFLELIDIGVCEVLDRSSYRNNFLIKIYPLKNILKNTNDTIGDTIDQIIKEEKSKVLTLEKVRASIERIKGLLGDGYITTFTSSNEHTKSPIYEIEIYTKSHQKNY